MCRWVVVSSAHFYTFCASHSMSCEFGAKSRPRGGPVSGIGLGWSLGQGRAQSSVDSWVAGRGQAPLLCLACMAWSRQGAEVLRPALELGWGPGLGSTRPLLEWPPGCCRGLGPGWRAGGGVARLGDQEARMGVSCTCTPAPLNQCEASDISPLPAPFKLIFLP